MILATAQTFPNLENNDANLKDHYRFARLAADNGANLMLFPEMSLSSYEREKATALAFSMEDSRLDELRALSADKNITLVAGAPVRMESDLFIGSFIINPDGTLLLYTKKYLHGEESNYFRVSPNHNPLIKMEDEQISFAICADINQPKHPEDAKHAGATVYAAGIFFEPHEMTRAHATLSGYAKNHSINVIMSNFVGNPYGLSGGGQSAFWNHKGELIAHLNGTDTGILFVEKEQDDWKLKTIYYE